MGLCFKQSCLSLLWHLFSYPPFKNLCHKIIYVCNKIFFCFCEILKVFCFVLFFLHSELLEKLCLSLYDVLRPMIIHVIHLETLSELCGILKNEMLEDHVQNNGNS